MKKSSQSRFEAQANARISAGDPCNKCRRGCMEVYCSGTLMCSSCEHQTYYTDQAPKFVQTTVRDSCRGANVDLTRPDGFVVSAADSRYVGRKKQAGSKNCEKIDWHQVMDIPDFLWDEFSDNEDEEGAVETQSGSKDSAQVNPVKRKLESIKEENEAAGETSAPECESTKLGAKAVVGKMRPIDEKPSDDGMKKRMSLVDKPLLAFGSPSLLDEAAVKEFPPHNIDKYLSELSRLGAIMGLRQEVVSRAKYDVRALYSRFNVRYYRSNHVAAAFLYHYDQQNKYGSFHSDKEFISKVEGLDAKTLRSILGKVVDKVRPAAHRKDRNDPFVFVYRLIHQVPGSDSLQGEVLHKLQERNRDMLERMSQLNLLGGRNPAGMAGAAFICAAEVLAMDKTLPESDRRTFHKLANMETRVASVAGVHKHTILNRKKEFKAAIATSLVNGLPSALQMERSELERVFLANDSCIDINISLVVDSHARQRPLRLTPDYIEQLSLNFQILRDLKDHAIVSGDTVLNYEAMPLKTVAETSVVIEDIAEALDITVGNVNEPDENLDDLLFEYSEASDVESETLEEEQHLDERDEYVELRREDDDICGILSDLRRDSE